MEEVHPLFYPRLKRPHFRLVPIEPEPSYQSMTFHFRIKKWRMEVAVNKPVGDNARKGAVKKRTQLKTTLGSATAWTKRNKKGGEFMAVKKPAKKTKAAKQ